MTSTRRSFIARLLAAVGAVLLTQHTLHDDQDVWPNVIEADDARYHTAIVKLNGVTVANCFRAQRGAQGFCAVYDIERANRERRTDSLPIKMLRGHVTFHWPS